MFALALSPPAPVALAHLGNHHAILGRSGCRPLGTATQSPMRAHLKLDGALGRAGVTEDLAADPAVVAPVKTESC
jgi:hypothetical protein